MNKIVRACFNSAQFTSCIDCIHYNEDMDLNGYCGCAGHPQFHRIVVDDNGCKVKTCNCFRPKVEREE